MLDVLIVGSGPAGLSAAIYAKRANLNVLVSEKMPYGTGQITQSSQVDNYLGFAGINGYELGAKFREHAVQLGVEFAYRESARFEEISGGWKVHFQDGEAIEAKAVIYTAGASHRRLGVPGEEEYAGKGVSYCATCDGAFFRGKVAVVVGGGNTALDDALYLSELCSKVCVVHRREEFRGSAGTVEELRQKPNTEFFLSAQVREITGEEKVSAVELTDGRKIATDGVFIAVGMVPQTEQVQGVADLDRNGYIIADETGTTSAKGFFVAGDARTKVLRQVVTAVSDGANAAFSVGEYLRKR